MRKRNRALAQRRLAAIGARSSSFSPHEPFGWQRAFLALRDELEVAAGGGAGGGKSDVLGLDALQFVDRRGYAGLILRRTFAELEKAGALMERMREWMHGTSAVWRAHAHRFVFPSGATLEFGHAEHPHDVYRFKSAEYQFIAIDQLEEWDEEPYLYLFSRLRKPKWLDVPLRMRSSFNPGGRGGPWIKKRFFEERKQHGIRVVLSTMDDNPHLDAQSRRALTKLSPLERARLEKGNFDVMGSGGMFERTWFPIVDFAPGDARAARFWDLAASDVVPGEKLPDWTRGARGVARGDRLWITGVVGLQGNPGRVREIVKHTASVDTAHTEVWIEQNKGDAGKILVDVFKEALPGHTVRGLRVTGDKVTRAVPLAQAAKEGRVALVRGEWNDAFLDELVAFPNGRWDDQVDAASGLYAVLVGDRESSLQVETGDDRTMTRASMRHTW